MGEDELTIGTILPGPEDAPEEDAEQESGDGFHDIFPEEPPQLADTVIPFNKQVKIVESAEFFLVYQCYVLCDPKTGFFPGGEPPACRLVCRKAGTAVLPG